MKIRYMIGLAATASMAVAGCATIEEGVGEAVSETYHATLTGANEVGGGDPDGYGEAEISVSDELNQICFELSKVTGIGPITAAHVHRGVAGANGPPVFTLSKSNEGNWQGCKADSEWTQDRIEGNPGEFYVNVHTAEYPGGAIRGQLHK